METKTDLSQERLLRVRPLDVFFRPRNVAVIGATETAGSVGRAILWNLMSNPFGGTVFPVNPKRSSVLGIKSYPNVAAIPEPLDLVVIATPAATVPGIIGECAETGGAQRNCDEMMILPGDELGHLGGIVHAQAMQTQCSCEENEIGRSVVEKRREGTSSPVELQVRRHAELDGVPFHVVENGHHRSENAEKYPGHFLDRCKSEFVCTINLPGRKQVNSGRNQNHDQLAPSRRRGNERGEEPEHENEIWRAIATPVAVGRGAVCAWARGGPFPKMQTVEQTKNDEDGSEGNQPGKPAAL